MLSADLTRLELRRSGGQLPGLRPVWQVDVDRLSPARRRQLDRLLSAVERVSDAPGSGAVWPDAFRYELILTGREGDPVTLRFADQDGHAAGLDALADWVRRNVDNG